MPTISVRVIKKPRKLRYCEGYKHQVLIPSGEPHVRLYGNAFYDDPPFAMYICLKCAKESDDEKIQEAVKVYFN